MVTRDAQIGGWSRGRLQLSLFIRDYLSDNESWAHDIYGAYVQAIEAIPKRRGKGKRRHISYHGFLVYMYTLRRLGLIEYVAGSDTESMPGQSIKTEEGDVPQLAKRHYIRMVDANSPAWQNPRKALYPHHGH